MPSGNPVVVVSPAGVAPIFPPNFLPVNTQTLDSARSTLLVGPDGYAIGVPGSPVTVQLSADTLVRLHPDVANVLRSILGELQAIRLALVLSGVSPEEGTFTSND